MLTIIRSSVLHIPKEIVSDPHMEFMIPNPLYGKYSKEPRYIYYFDETPTHYTIPRNCSVKRFLRAHPGLGFIEASFEGDPLSSNIQFNGVLHPFQEKVVATACADNEDEIIQSPCGSGKTVIGLCIAFRRGRKTAILVPTEQLMEQWVERIKAFLGYEAGVYYSAKKELFDITVFSIASLFRKGAAVMDTSQFDQYGTVICDETHRLGALEWGNAIKCFKAQKRIGLTATPNRPDGLDVLMYNHIGEIRSRIPHEQLVDAGIVMVPEILPVVFEGDKSIYKTKKWSGEFDFVATCNSIAANDSRNAVLANLIFKAYCAGRRILVLINRVSHIDALTEHLAQRGDVLKEIGVLKGGTANKEEVLSKRIIIGMLSLVKEGLDEPGLDTVVIGVPISDYGMVEQVLGRISRVAPGKKQPLIVDVHDKNSKNLLGMAYKRIALYKRLGCAFRGEAVKK